MLEGLDAINWAELRHAYGSASDVPALLRALLSDDPQTAEQALYELHASIWHQGTVYEATSYAVPFLVKSLDHGPTRDKAGILGLLEVIAEGVSYADVHHRDPEVRNAPEIRTTIAQELAWVQSARDAVRQGSPTYARLLREGDHWARIFATRILAKFPQDAAPIAATLQDALSQEPDPAVRVEIIGALGDLLGMTDDPPAATRHKSLATLEALLGASDAPIQLAAAIAIARVTGAATPANAVALLVHGLMHPERYSAYESDMIGMLSHHRILPVVRGMGLSAGIPVLVEALGQVEAPDTAHEVAAAALGMAFQGPDLDRYGRAYGHEGSRPTIHYWGGSEDSQTVTQHGGITDEQTTVLYAVLRSASFWETKTNLLSLFGLPGNRKTLERFVQQHCDRH
jgi:hypothetical protein